MTQDDVVALLAQLSDDNWTQRRQVVTALARAGDIAVAPLCSILLSERSDETRLASTVEALVASAGDADGALLDLLGRHPPTATLCDAIVVLGRRRSKRAIASLETLTSHSDANVALAAIEALGRIGGGAGIDALLALAQARDFFRTFPAVEVLGKSGDPRAVSVLIELLDDPLYVMLAARALGESADVRVIAPLMVALLAGDDTLVRACAVALMRSATLHGHRFAKLPEALQTEASQQRVADVAQRAWGRADQEERSALAALLAWIGGQAAIATLLSLARDEANMSVAVADALRVLGRRADPLLLEVIGGGSSQQRRLLLPLVEGRPDNPTPIIVCLKDDDPEVRSAAADTLARLGAEAAIDPLFAALHDDDARVVDASVNAIEAMDADKVEARALAAARDGDAKVRRAGLVIVAHFAFPSGATELLAGAADADTRVREAALPGLATLAHPAAKSALLAAAQHAVAQTRIVAVRTIGNLRCDTDVEIALSRALSDPDAWVRYYACLSIGRLGLSALSDAVAERLEDPAGQVPIAAIEALGHLGGERARLDIEQATHANEADIRRAALVALGVLHADNSSTVLLEHVTSADPAARLVALSSLAHFAGPAVVQALRRAAFDAELVVRNTALRLLSARDDAASAQALIDLLDQRDLRDAVTDALGAHEKHLPYLAAALDTAGHERSMALVSALLRMRTHEADKVLMDAIKIPNTFARRAAATGLGSLRTAEARDLLRRVASEDVDAEVRERAGAKPSS